MRHVISLCIYSGNNCILLFYVEERSDEAVGVVGGRFLQASQKRLLLNSVRFR